MREYDYSKLNGRIKEIFGTQDNYAKKLGISVASVNYKLNNKVAFTQDEIYKSIHCLNIKNEEIQEIFFTKKVEKTQQANSKKIDQESEE